MTGLMWLADASSRIQSGIDAACSGDCNKSLTLGHLFANITNILIFIVGAVAVIMVIVGALRYVTANGDPKSTTAAKDTILYAVIGIVVSIASYAIVNFVVKNIGK